MKHRLMRFLCLLLALALCIPSALAYNKLQRGDKSADVLAMQKALQALGYPLEADGSFGSATYDAVIAFQKTHNLKQDGIAGNDTLTLLYALAGNTGNQTGGTGSSSSGSAGSGTTTAIVSTPSSYLNLRYEARDNSQVLTTIPSGTQIQVTKRGDTWCAVFYDGFAGYVMTRYLSFSGNAAVTPAQQPTATPAVSSGMYAKVTTASGSLNLRATRNGRVLRTIPQNAVIQILEKGSEWCKTTYGSYTGFVKTEFLTFLSDQPTAAPTQTIFAPTSTPASGKTYATVTTASGSLNLRERADKNASVLTKIPQYAQVEVLAYGSVWCQVVYNGITGYAMTSFLTLSGTPAQPTPTPMPTSSGDGTVAWVSTSGGSLNLREAARSGAAVLTTIPNGTQLSVTQRGSIWCAVIYHGRSGYVMTEFLRFAASPTSAPTVTVSPTPTAAPSVSSAVVTTSGGSLNLRAEQSGSAKVLANIPNATVLTVQSRGSTWCAVTYNGMFGYVMTKYLTFGISPDVTKSPSNEEDNPSAYRRTLKSGMTGADVDWVQSRLSELGYSLKKSGVYDATTISAVKAFQKQNGLGVDGLAGAQTFAVLASDYARRASDSPLSYTSLSVNNSGSSVTNLQKALIKLGYNLKANGEYDVATHDAVVAFQQRNGLVISGIADALTQQALYSGSGKPYSTPVEELPADAGKTTGPATSEIKLLHWQQEIKPTVSSGQTITIFDPNTSLSWKIKFYSLGRHADSEPLTWRDTQIMNRSFGTGSWTIHPVYVQLPDGRWTMATMHNRPHLYGSITNNGFGGHLCIHFLRDMDEAKKNDPNYGVNNQLTLRSAWKALTGITVD